MSLSNDERILPTGQKDLRLSEEEQLCGAPTRQVTPLRFMSRD